MMKIIQNWNDMHISQITNNTSTDQLTSHLRSAIENHLYNSKFKKIRITKLFIISKNQEMFRDTVAAILAVDNNQNDMELLAHLNTMQFGKPKIKFDLNKVKKSDLDRLKIELNKCGDDWSQKLISNKLNSFQNYNKKNNMINYINNTYTIIIIAIRNYH